jgi:hypothetical protein
MIYLKRPDRALPPGQNLQMEPSHGTPSCRRVCVWFGDHQIVEHIADAPYAAQFEHAMRRRFASLRVTNEPVMPDAAS